MENLITETTTVAEELWPEYLAANGGRRGDFVDINKYPEIVALCKEIKRLDPLLRKLSSRIPYIPWIDDQLAGKDWSIATMRHANIDHNPIIPSLMIPIVRGLDFAVLQPGGYIVPHAGYLGDSFRLHYGLDIPEGDCGARVGVNLTKWESGKFFMFNDLDIHEVWNYTEHPRLIFMVEINKDQLSHIEETDRRV